MPKPNISLVSYWNTLPFLHGLKRSGLDQQFDITPDIPSVCAQKMIRGEASIGLVPVAVIPEIKNARIISDYCIGTSGEVGTVCLFSEKPLEDLKTIYLDYQSRTSVRLTALLLRNYWNWTGELIPAKPGYETQIQGNVGGLIIGDRAIEALPKFEFIYDLGTAWKSWTGKPFVFAAWVTNQELDFEVKQELNQAFQLGMEAIPALIENQEFPYSHFSLERYYTEFISYTFDAAKQSALELFLSKLGFAIPTYA